MEERGGGGGGLGKGVLPPPTAGFCTWKGGQDVPCVVTPQSMSKAQRKMASWDHGGGGDGPAGDTRPVPIAPAHAAAEGGARAGTGEASSQHWDSPFYSQPEVVPSSQTSMTFESPVCEMKLPAGEAATTARRGYSAASPSGGTHPRGSHREHTAALPPDSKQHPPPVPGTIPASPSPPPEEERKAGHGQGAGKRKCIRQFGRVLSQPLIPEPSPPEPPAASTPQPPAGAPLSHVPSPLQQSAAAPAPQCPPTAPVSTGGCQWNAPHTQGAAAHAPAGNPPAAGSWGEALGLPPLAVSMFASERGIRQPFEWQRECLTLPCIAKNANLVYSLPTSAGKTFVAEVLLIKALLSGGPRVKCLLVEPFVSIAQEKAGALEPFGQGLGFEVECFHGCFGVLPLPKKSRHLCVATIERAERVLTSLMEEGREGELRLVVVDELHFCGEKGRGPVLEVLLSRMKTFFPRCQVVAMSATVPNVGDFAKWLSARLYQSPFRPVTLRARVKCGDCLLNGAGEVVRRLPKLEEGDVDHLYFLVSEVSKDHCVLVFCSSRAQVEAVAKALASLGAKRGVTPSGELAAKRAELVAELRAGGSAVSAAFEAMLLQGVGFHHSGLSSDERAAIEGAFKGKALSVLVATTTLAAGVNLPARRVVIRSPYIARDFLTAARFWQMAGRAGRAGLDDEGEAVVVCGDKDRERTLGLLRDGVAPVMSQLSAGGWGENSFRGGAEGGKGAEGELPAEGSAFVRTVLGFVCCAHESARLCSSQQSRGRDDAPATPIVVADAAVLTFMRGTLLGIQTSADPQPLHPPGDGAGLDKSVQDALAWLAGQSFIGGSAEGGWEPLGLGIGTFKSTLPPEMAKIIWDDMVHAREQGVILSDPLHLLYLCTPFDRTKEPAWGAFASRFANFSADRHRVAARVGVEERSVALKAQGRVLKRSAETLLFERSARRLYAAMILDAVMNETPTSDIVRLFDSSSSSVLPSNMSVPASRVDRGYLEDLQANASTFAHMVSKFASLVGFEDLSVLFQELTRRVAFGVRTDLLPLCEIPYVKAARARSLFKGGYRTVRHVAEADPKELVRVMGTSLGAKPSRVAGLIIRSAGTVLQRQVEDKRRELEELGGVV